MVRSRRARDGVLAFVRVLRGDRHGAPAVRRPAVYRPGLRISVEGNIVAEHLAAAATSRPAAAALSGSSPFAGAAGSRGATLGGGTAVRSGRAALRRGAAFRGSAAFGAP